MDLAREPMPDRRMKCLDLLAALSLALLAGPRPAAAEPAGPDAGLTARGSFSVPAARAGDTLEYRLRVEWRDVPAALMVLPPRDELKTHGFRVIGQSASHLKTASAGSIRNISEYSYLLVAGSEGRARVAPFLLRYRSDLSGRTGDRIESIPVEGSALEIGPARIPFLKRKPVQGAAAFLAALMIAGLLFAAAKRARRSVPPRAGKAPEDPFAREVAELKARCDVADSRAWLRDAEKLCVAYLCRDLGVSRVREVRFEAALDRYLARRPARDPEGEQSWTKLRDLFHEARYAGGRKEPHELRDACRHLKICLAPHASGETSSVTMEKHS
jgi:hypothetical protein